jgi:hypothetical protein
VNNSVKLAVCTATLAIFAYLGTSSALTRTEVIDLTTKGVSAEMIIRFMKAEKSVFNLSVDDIVNMSKAGVDSNVVLEMDQSRNIGPVGPNNKIFGSYLNDNKIYSSLFMDIKKSAYKTRRNVLLYFNVSNQAALEFATGSPCTACMKASKAFYQDAEWRKFVGSNALVIFIDLSQSYFDLRPFTVFDSKSQPTEEFKIIGVPQFFLLTRSSKYKDNIPLFGWDRAALEQAMTDNSAR